MTKKYSEISGSCKDFQLPLLSDLVGEEITIVGVRFDQGSRGKYAVVELEDGDQYRTSAGVLLSQLEEIADYIGKTGENVLARLSRRTSAKGRGYPIFE